MSEREREQYSREGMSVMVWHTGGKNTTGDVKMKVMESLYGKGGMYAGGSGVMQAKTMRMKTGGVDAAAQNMLVPSVAEAELKKQSKFGTCMRFIGYSRTQ